MAKRRPQLSLKLLAVVLGVLAVGILYLVLRSPYHDVANLAAPGQAVVVLGDSIAWGYPDGPDIAYPAKLATALGVPVINAGKTGDTTTGALDRLDDDVLSKQPRLVIVELGGNDYLQKDPPAKVALNLETIFNRIQQKGAMAMFVGVLTPFHEEYQAAFRDVTRRCHVFYVPNVLQDIVAHPDLMADSIHPNAKGQEKIATRLLKDVKGLLEAGDRARR